MKTERVTTSLQVEVEGFELKAEIKHSAQPDDALKGFTDHSIDLVTLIWPREDNTPLSDLPVRLPVSPGAVESFIKLLSRTLDEMKEIENG